ncbi:hypothetical protein [uncultured Streptomyces sp.]|uniref:hypothetical protein n=1 Tax=uncultured Streptomyces sp. TaxID=174707 RepID=UPI00261344AA|nr:hypothetical protein [uncultured Streptomyces sp.]
MTIHVSPQLNNLLFVLIGERMLQADEDKAYASHQPYHRLGKRVVDLSDLIEQSVVGVGRALPPQVGNNYVRAMNLFVDSGGTNYLREFAGQLDTIAQGRVKSSMDIMESKWQIIAELIRLLIELAIILALSIFTGGSAASQAAVAKARSRVAILTALDTLLKRTHLMPSLSEAFEEAFTTFAVRLAMMTQAPPGRRPDGFDWGQILKDGAFGALAGGFHELFSHVTKTFGKTFTNIFDNPNGNPFNKNLTDITTKVTTPPPPRNKWLDETADIADNFLVSGASESVAEIFVNGLFDGKWTTSLDTFLGSGISSVVEKGLGDGTEKFGSSIGEGLGFHDINVDPVTIDRADTGGGDGRPDTTGGGPGAFVGPGASGGNRTGSGAGTGTGTGTGVDRPGADGPTVRGPGSTDLLDGAGGRTIDVPGLDDVPSLDSVTRDEVTVSGGGTGTAGPGTTGTGTSSTGSGSGTGTTGTGTTGTTASGTTGTGTTGTGPKGAGTDGDRFEDPAGAVGTVGTGDLQGGASGQSVPPPGAHTPGNPGGAPAPSGTNSARNKDSSDLAANDDRPQAVPSDETDAPVTDTSVINTPGTGTSDTDTTATSTDVTAGTGGPDTAGGAPVPSEGTGSSVGTGIPGTAHAPDGTTGTGGRTVADVVAELGGSDSVAPPAPATPAPSPTTAQAEPPVVVAPPSAVAPGGAPGGAPGTGTAPAATAPAATAPAAGTGQPGTTPSGARPAPGAGTPADPADDTSGSVPDPAADETPTDSAHPQDGTGSVTDGPAPTGTAPTDGPPPTGTTPADAPVAGTTPATVAAATPPPVTPQPPPGWSDARDAAAVEPRRHTWVDPVSTPPTADGTGTTQYVVDSAFDVRRFVHDGEPVTDLTVEVAFTDGHLVPESVRQDLWQRTVAGVERVFNAPGHRLPGGERLHVTVVPAAPGSTPHLEVRLTADPDAAMSQHTWATDATENDLAHEIGHQLGLRDEYRDSTAPHRPAVSGSLMGAYDRPVTESTADAGEPAPVLVPPAVGTDGRPLPPVGAGYAQAGLRPRHLALLNAVVGDPSPPVRGATSGAETSEPTAPRPSTTASSTQVPGADPLMYRRRGKNAKPDMQGKDDERASSRTTGHGDGTSGGIPLSTLTPAPTTSDSLVPPPPKSSRTLSAPPPSDPSPRPSAYVRDYGSRRDGIVGLVHVEPLPDHVVDGLHRQVLTALGLPADTADSHPVLVRVRDVLSAEAMSLKLAYLLSTAGHPVTVTVDGRPRTVHVRLTLHDPQPNRRDGEHYTADPDIHVERRGQGTQESGSTEGSGNIRTIPVPWTGAFPIMAAGSTRAVDLTPSLSLTHNQYSSSSTVTQVVQSTSAQRSNEASQGFTFDSRWQVRVDDGATPTAPPLWGTAQSHGPVTVWFPEHLAAPDADGKKLPAPAALDDLPVWGVDSVAEPGRLLREAHSAFAGELNDLSEASRQELAAFLSEPVLRGTLPMQRGRGVFSPVLLDGRGRAVGVLRLTTAVQLQTPTHGSLDGKINLESHVVHTVKVEGQAKYTSGIAVDVNVNPAFTGDTSAGHAAASTAWALAAPVGKGGLKYETSDALSSGGSAAVMHAVRSNRSHLLTPSTVTHTLTLLRPGGGEIRKAMGPWRNGMQLRVLSAADALGTNPAEVRSLPAELDRLESVGLSATPLGVTGADPLFDQAAQWLRTEGYLPSATHSRSSVLPDEALVQAQLANLRRFETARSDVGLRAATDGMVDGGHSLWLDRPTPTGTQRVRLRLGATRDTAAPVAHVKSLPGIQSMGLAVLGVPGAEQQASSYGFSVGLGAGGSTPVGNGAWSLGGAADAMYVGQVTHQNTVGSGIGHEQFFIGSGQDGEVFDVPARLSLDLFDGPGDVPRVRFAAKVPTRTPGPPPTTVPGVLKFSVPHHRTLPGSAPAPAPAPHVVRAPVTAPGPRNDEDRMAMVRPDGTPRPDVVRMPDDALVDVVKGSEALMDAFRQYTRGPLGATTGTGVLPTHNRPAPRNPADAGPVVAAGRAAAGSLVGQKANDSTTVAHEVLAAALSPGTLTARAHQIFKGGYVVEGITLPGLGADEEISVEIRGVLHDAQYRHDVKQYLETGLGSNDSATSQRAYSSALRTGVAGTLSQNNPKSPAPAPGTPSDARKPDRPDRFGMSGRYGYVRKVENTDSVGSITAVNRTPTESGTQHRVAADATYLVTIRRGFRNGPANSVGLGGHAPVTLAVDVPQGVQFLMTDHQYRRDASWFGGMKDAPAVPAAPVKALAPPGHFSRTGEVGHGAVLSVTPLSKPGGPPARRDRVRAELTALVEREAPGATLPGHASYLPGVRSRIADYTSPTGLRSLPGRGPAGVQRFHFRHVALGGARLVEVTLSARPRPNPTQRAALRGAEAGAGTGLEQWHGHTPSVVSHGTTSTRQHTVTLAPLARYPRPASDTRTDRNAGVLTASTTRAHGVKTTESAEDRYWMRTDGAADFDVEYDYVMTVRSELVTDWPPNVVGGLLTNGVVSWNDADDGLVDWLTGALTGRPARTAAVPAAVSLRFTGGEAGDRTPKRGPVDPEVSTESPRGKGSFTEDTLFEPSGPTPTFGFNAWQEVATALDTVAPGQNTPWRSLTTSTSSEAAAVRLGELIQAGEIALDRPRTTGGLTDRMPGAWVGNSGPFDAPTISVSLHDPRLTSDTGDVTLDRLRLYNSVTTSTSSGGTGFGLSFQAAYAADDPNRHTVGATVPVLVRQPQTAGETATASGAGRDWLKTGTTAAPKGERGTRTYAALVDVHLTVRGPDGTRHVTGTTTMRMTERDALGYGVLTRPDPDAEGGEALEHRPLPGVYDVPGMLADQPAGDLRDWTRHPLDTLPSALADRIHPDDGAAGLWLALGADPGGVRRARALHAASGAARIAGKPVELTLRTGDGLRRWSFAADGSLNSGPTAASSVRTAWTAFTRQSTALTEAARAQEEAHLLELSLRPPQATAHQDLADAETTLTGLESAAADARLALGKATARATETGRLVTEADDTLAQRSGDRVRLRDALAGTRTRIAADVKTETRLAAEAQRADDFVKHVERIRGAARRAAAAAERGTAVPDAATVPDGLPSVETARTRAAEARANLTAVREKLAARRLDAERAAQDLKAAEEAVTDARGLLDAARTEHATAVTEQERAASLARAADARVVAATTARDEARAQRDARDAEVAAAVAEQVAQGAAQDAAAARLPALGTAVSTARAGTGEGRVDGPLGSLASAPARRPGSATPLPNAAPPPASGARSGKRSGSTDPKASKSGSKPVTEGTGSTKSAKKHTTGRPGTAPVPPPKGSTSAKPSSKPSSPGSVPPQGTTPPDDGKKPVEGTGTEKKTTGPDTGTGGKGKEKAAAPTGAPAHPAGSPVRTPGNGECLLYAFIGSDPLLIRDRLAGRPDVDAATLRWLSDPARVRADVAWIAGVLSETDVAPPHRPSETAVAALRAYTAEYLHTAALADDLPDEVVGQYRLTRADAFTASLHTMNRPRLLALLDQLDVDSVRHPQAFARADLIARYDAATGANTDGTAPVPRPTDQAMVDRLGALGVLPAPHALNTERLRALLAAAYTESRAPLTDDELTRLGDAVAGWSASWGSYEGEVFLPLLAHALDVRADALRAPGAVQVTAVTTVGPAGATRGLQVFYGNNHYSAATAGPLVLPEAEGAPHPTSQAPRPVPADTGPQEVRPSARRGPSPVAADREDWARRRAGAPAGRLHTERFDPHADPLAAPPRPGTLGGATTLVRASVRRVQTKDGSWVRDLTVTLPVAPSADIGPERLDAFRERMRSILDAHVNHGHTLPGSGDHLNIGVELVTDPSHPEHVTLTDSPEPGAADQRTWDLGHPDSVLLHEVLHYVGLPDEQHDERFLFRIDAASSAVHTSGVMASTAPVRGLPEHYLAVIEQVADSGPVVRDHPYDAAPAPRSGPSPEPATALTPEDGPDPTWPVSAAPRDGNDPDDADSDADADGASVELTFGADFLLGPSAAGPSRTRGGPPPDTLRFSMGSLLNDDASTASDPYAAWRARPLLTADYVTALPAHDADPLFRTLYPPSVAVPQPLAGDGHAEDPVLALPLEQTLAAPRPVLRVSEDGTLAIVGEGGHVQEAYATPAVLARAVTRLRAAGSGVTLETDGATVMVPGPDGPVALLRVRPVFTAGKPPVEICRDFAAGALGGFPAYGVFRDPSTGTTAPVQLNAEDEMELTGTHLLARAMAEVADGSADPEETGPAWAALRMGEDPRTKGGRAPWFLPGEEYGGALRLDGPDPDRLDAVTDVARRIGVNQFAWAAVGEGYVVQSIGAPDAEGGYGLRENHAKPDPRPALPFGYHFATVVLESEDGLSQVSLENFARRRHIQDAMNGAIEDAMARYGPRLEQLLAQVDRRIAAYPDASAATGPRRRLEGGRRYLDALIRVRDGRGRVARLAADQQPGPETAELVEERRALDMAEKTAGLHLIQMPPAMDSRRWWHMKMYTRRPGESFHEQNAALLPDEPDAVSAVYNPLTLVVLGQEPPGTLEIEFPEGTKALSEEGSYRVAGATREVARLSLWNEEYGLRPPSVTLTGYGNGTRLPGVDRAGRARETAGERVTVTAREFERALGESLERLLADPPSTERTRALVDVQRRAAGLDLPADDPGAAPDAPREVRRARRRRVTLSVDAGRAPGTSGTVPPTPRTPLAFPPTGSGPAPLPSPDPRGSGGFPGERPEDARSSGPYGPEGAGSFSAASATSAAGDRAFADALLESLRLTAPPMVWSDGFAEAMGFGWLVADDAPTALRAWARDQLLLDGPVPGTSLPDGDDPVSMDELARIGHELTGSQHALAVMMGGDITVADAGLTSDERIDLLLNRPSSRAYADVVAALVARGLAQAVVITGPGTEVRRFGAPGGDPVRLRFDGTTYTVAPAEEPREEPSLA